MSLRLGFLASLVLLYVAGTQLAAHHAPTWAVASLMGVVFLALVAAMYLRVLPALLALPLLAFGLAAVAGMEWKNLLSVVFGEGSVRLAGAILAAIMGSILAQVVEKTGIAQTAIKKTAELGGDRPMILTVLLTIVMALLFTTLGGLGAVIMVATIVIPILLSLGLRPLYVGCLFLLAMSLGGAFNLTNWALYQGTLDMNVNQISAFALPFAGVMLFFTFAFLIIEGARLGKARYKATIIETATPPTFVPWYALLTPLIPLIPVLVFALIPRIWTQPAQVTFNQRLDPKYGIHVSINEKKDVARLEEATRLGLSDALPTRDVEIGRPLSLKDNQKYLVSVQYDGKTGITKSVGGEFLAEPNTVNDITINFDIESNTLKTAVTTTRPFEFPIVVALLLGVLYGAVTTWKKGASTVQLLTKSAFDGVAAVGPALVLMVGIGMVLKAAAAPEVSGVISPLLAKVVPQGQSGIGTMVHYVLLFSILAPLALYRGPLNLWGMGGGLVAMLKGLMPPGAIMGAFMSVGMIQGVCDPTNTHNVWIANYTNTDVQDILKRTLPYMWILAIAGLILSTVLYYGGVIK